MPKPIKMMNNKKQTMAPIFQYLEHFSEISFDSWSFCGALEFCVLDVELAPFFTFVRGSTSDSLIMISFLKVTILYG